MTNRISFSRHNVLNYKKNCVDKNEIGDVFKLSPLSQQSLKNIFPCDELAMFIAIQTPEMMDSNPQGRFWKESFLKDKSESEITIIASTFKKDFNNLIQTSMQKIFDDIMFQSHKTSTIAIYSRLNGYSQIAGVIMGAPNPFIKTRVDFFYSINPDWTLGKKRPQQQERF